MLIQKHILLLQLLEQFSPDFQVSFYFLTSLLEDAADEQTNCDDPEAAESISEMGTLVGKVTCAFIMALIINIHKVFFYVFRAPVACRNMFYHLCSMW